MSDDPEETTGDHSTEDADDVSIFYDQDASAAPPPAPASTDPSGYNPDVLEFLHADAKRVVDHQIDDLDDIDDKALRTVRITMVVFGILVASAQLEGAEAVVTRWTLAGSSLLIGSIIAGVLTYSASNPHFGPGPDYLESVLEESYSATEERYEAVSSYASWMRKNEGIVQQNGTYLLITQVLLIAGLICLAYGIGDAVTEGNLFLSLTGMFSS